MNINIYNIFYQKLATLSNQSFYPYGAVNLNVSNKKAGGDVVKGKPIIKNNNEVSLDLAHDLSVAEKNISYLSGMNIRLAGRLMTQSMRPRFTVQSIQEGSLARVKVHFIEKSRFTGKNKRGAFSFTVSISHVFN